MGATTNLGGALLCFVEHRSVHASGRGRRMPRAPVLCGRAWPPGQVDNPPPRQAKDCPAA